MLPTTSEERVQFFLAILKDSSIPMSQRLSKCQKILAHCEKFKGTKLGVKYWGVEPDFIEAMYEYSRKAII